MSVSFPLKTNFEREIESLLNVLGSVVVDRAAVYVSTPITSGRRFVDWSRRRNLKTDLSHPETHQEFVREVLVPNNEHARKIIGQMRRRFAQPLIDPTALKDMEGWVQDDYRVLWARVIEEYAGSVVFLDGWQYSNGCAYEFLIAHRLDPQPSILNEVLASLKLEEGMRLVESAILELQSSKLSSEFLREVLNELMKLHESEEVLTEV